MIQVVEWLTLWGMISQLPERSDKNKTRYISGLGIHWKFVFSLLLWLFVLSPSALAQQQLLRETGQLTDDDAQLDDGSRYDIYQFQGQAGQTLRITLESSVFDTYLLLLNPEGQLIAENDDTSSGPNAEIVVQLPVDGQYQVVANSYDQTGRGEYLLTVIQATEAELQQSVLQAEATRLFNQGLEQYNRSQFQEAINSWEQSLAIVQEIGNRIGEGTILSNLGNAYWSLSQYQQAIEFHEQHLAIAREIGDRAGEGDALGNLGTAYDGLSEFSRAIEFYEQSLSIIRGSGDHVVEIRTLNNLGAAYSSLGQYVRAIGFHEQSLVIAQDFGSQTEEAYALGSLGNAYLGLGEFSRAIEFYEQSLTIAQEIGDRASEGIALGNLGLAYDGLSQYSRAIEFHNQSLAISQELNNLIGEASSLSNLGNAYRQLGQYSRAIELSEQSLTIAQQIGARAAEGQNLNNLGSAYLGLGQYVQAIEFIEQGLIISQEVGNRNEEALSQLNLGNAYYRLGQLDRAIQSFEKSLIIFQEIGAHSGEAGALGGIGLAYNDLGQFELAIEFIEPSLSISQEIGDRNGEATALANLSTAYGGLGQYTHAIELLEQSLAISQEINRRVGEGNALNNLGVALSVSNRFAEAEAVLLQSIETYESIRTNLADEQLIAIADTQAKAYANLEGALIAQNKITEALVISERGRAQAFALELALRQGNTSETPVTFPTIDEIQHIAQQQNSTLVEYSLSHNPQTLDPQTLNIWVIRPSGDIQLRQVSLTDFSTETLNAFIQQTRDALGIRGTRAGAPPQARPEIIAQRQAETDQNLKDLHNLLIAPIAGLLPTNPEANVVFIPQGELFLVPFPALKDETGTYLIEKHTIATAPSIQVLGLAGDEAGNNRITGDALVVGNPTMPVITIAENTGFQEIQLAALPSAQREAEAIGSFLNISPLIGNQATEAQVKAQLPTANLIHLATHGLLEYGDPQASGVRDFPGAIALTPGNGEDGLLTASEILDMELQASLAILSACDTGRGRITGDGVVGLSRSLITAGVPSVIVSLWSVPDAPTADLMTEFYRQLDQGQTKAQALRQAMLMTMAQHPEPRSWAAFSLIGAAE